MNYKNDISFVFDFELLLYEHQSTINPNMPLRDLIYVTKVLQGRIRNDDLYSETLIKIPSPRFVVFYNVNLGFNAELMEACHILKEYAQFVKQIRLFKKKIKNISEAMEKAVDYCIKNNILSDFLLKNRAEAVEVCIFEYDEEKHMKHERAIWKKEGEERLLKLLEILKVADRMDDIERAITDKEYREQLYRENNLGM